MIIEIVAMLIVKKSMKKVKAIFWRSQLIAFFLMIQVYYPVNVQIFLQEVGSFTRFELISPKFLASHLLSSEMQEKWFGEVDQNLSSNLKNSGFSNTVVLSNLSFLLPLLAVSLVVILLLVVMLLFKKTREFSKKMIEKFKTKMVWNGIIDTMNTEFLPMSMWVTAFVIMKFQEDQPSIGDIYKLSGCCLVVLLIIIGLAFQFGKYTNDQYLSLPYLDKIKSFTENTNMVQSKASETIMKLRRMTYLMNVLFRFLFAMTSAIFYQRTEFQIFYLIFCSLFFTSYDLWVDAEIVESGFLKKVYSINKFINHNLYLGLFVFTDFVLDKEL